MKPIKPKLIIPGDREDNIMWEAGYIVGFHIHKWPIKKGYKVVWCFGFLPDSVQAKAYGVSVEQQTWIIADAKGNVEEAFTGRREDLPINFWHILSAEGIFLKTEKEEK